MLTIKIKDNIHNSTSKSFQLIRFAFYCKHGTAQISQHGHIIFCWSQTSDVQNEAHHFCPTLKPTTEYKKSNSYQRKSFDDYIDNKTV